MNSLLRISAIAATVALVALACTGCGGGASSSNSGGNSTPSPTPSPTPTPATLQAGQWEFVLTPPPTTGGQPVYLESNLTVAGSSVFSTVFNTKLFQNGSPTANNPEVFTLCNNFTVNASISGTTLSGSLDSPGASSSEATFSGTIAANGQSISNGSFAEPSIVCGMSPALQGTFTGYTVSPVNGIYSGTLSGNGQDQFTLQISQNSTFGITASGTAVNAGVTTNLAILPDGTPPDNISGNSNVFGAVVLAIGAATNVNGSSTF